MSKIHLASALPSHAGPDWSCSLTRTTLRSQLGNCIANFKPLSDIRRHSGERSYLHRTAGQRPHNSPAIVSNPRRRVMGGEAKNSGLHPEGDSRKDATSRRHPIYRVHMIPSSANQDDFSKALSIVLDVDCWRYGLEIGSLAVNFDGVGQVATISFSQPPPKLTPTSETTQWLFTKARPENDVLSVKLDTHFLGLTVLYAPDSTRTDLVDCVAVSGIGSHSFGSFKERGGSFMWLRDALPEDFPNLRVVIHGYDSALHQNPRPRGIADFGRDFRTDLMKMRSVGDANRPLVFIAHSFGGIVVKEALLRMNEATETSAVQATVCSVRAVIGFGVPHLGMDARSFLPIVSGQPNQPFVESIMNGSTYLEDLDEAWQHLVRKRNIKLFSFYECLRSPTAVQVNEQWRMEGPNTTLVSRASAASGHPDSCVRGVLTTHSDLVKLGKSSDLYREICRILRQLIGG